MWTLLLSLLMLPLCGSTIDEDPSSFLAITDGDSSSNIGGCVSVITGDYLISESDFCFQGLEPIVIRRNYISARATEKGAGWHFESPRASFHPYDCVGHKKCGVIRIHYRGINLDLIPDTKINQQSEGYFTFMQDTRFHLHPDSLKVGLTNYSNGQINDNHNLFNIFAIFRKDIKIFTVFFPDGRELHFELVPGQIDYEEPREYPSSYEYRCINERLETGNYLEHMPAAIRDNPDGSHPSIRTLDPMQTLVLASATRKNDKRGKKEKGNPPVTIFGSDGKRVHFENWYPEHKLRWALQNIQGTETPDESYTYDQFKAGKHTKHTLITHRTLPDGRRLRIEYYSIGDHQVAGHHINIGDKYDRRYLKVKRICGLVGEKGEDLPLYEFVYNFGKVDQHGGFTDVYDVVGNRSRYHYDANLRLTQIETYEKEKLHKLEKFKWGSIKDHPPIYLSSKTLLDGNQNPISLKTYHYNNNGDLVLEKAYGNWTGYQHTPLQLDGQGNPLEGSGEVIEIVKTYTQDSRHLLESVKEGDLETRYSYIQGAPKLATQFQLDRGQIAKRKFYLYDKHLFLTAIIEDDGCGAQIDDLTGVTRRTFERHTPGMQGSFIGLPIRIEHSYLDTESGSEKLLHAEERVYGKYAKVVLRKIFDEKNQPLYTITYEHDAKGKIISETNPLGQIARYEYDGCLNKIYERHFDGVTENRSLYDLGGRNTSNTLTTPTGTYLETYRYSTQSKLIEKKDALGQKTSYRHDAFGRLIEESSPKVERISGELAADVQKWTYNLLGCVTETISPSNDLLKITPSTAGKPLIVQHPNGAIERYFYDLSARLIRHIQPDETEILYEYDGFSRPLSKKILSSKGELLATEEWDYSGFNLLSHKAPSGVITEYSYDGAGRKIAEKIVGTDLVKEYQYDGFNQLIEERSSTSQHTQVFRKKYDLLQRVVWEGTYSQQGLVLEKFYTYDAHSNCVKTEMRKGEEVAVSLKEYDALDRLTLETDPDGLSTSYTYQEVEDDRFAGKLLKKTTLDPKGYKTIELFDPKNRIIESMNADLFNRPLHRELKFYHPSGALQKHHTEVFRGHEVHEGVTTHYEIGSLGKAISQTRSANHPLTRTEYYHYDLKGRLIEHIKENGTSLLRSYNGLDQAMSLKSSTGDLDYQFQYHRCGKVEFATDLVKRTQTHRVYDQLGRLLYEQLDHGVRINSSYDDLHGKTELILPSWGSIQYHYGDFYLEEISIHTRNKDPLHHRFLEYNFLAQPTLEEDIYGSSIEKSYAPTGKFLKVHSRYGSHIVNARNRGGQITSQTWTSPKTTQTKTYEYDSLSHLASESSSNSNRSYAYSSIHQVIENSREPLRYNTLQELTQVGSKPISHDEAGRSTTCIVGNKTCSLDYDSLDRLIKVTSNDYIIHYHYDPFDRLTVREIKEWCYAGITECTQETLFIWDENKLVALLDPYTRKYEEVRVLRPSNLADWGTTIALEKAGVFYAALSDLQGNLWQLNNPQGHLEARFTSYGEAESSSISHFGFLSKWSDPKTHLVYFGKRFYDPKTSRFLTKDPKGFVDGLNLYGFCKGDPLSYTDLYGLEAINPSPSFLDRVSSFFDRLFENAGNACRRFGEGFYRVNEDWNVVPVLRRLGQAVGNYLQGQTSPTPRDRSREISIGTPQPKQTYLIFTNGIRTSSEESTKALENIHEKLGGKNVLGNYNSSDGLLADIAEAAYQKLGGDTRASKLLAERIQGIIKSSDSPINEIRILLIAHSQGGITVANAVKLLSDTERSCLSIATFGSAELFKRTTESDLVHFVSSRDPVPLLTNPISYFTNKDIVRIAASKGKALDHSFMNEAYQGKLNDFLEKHFN